MFLMITYYFGTHFRPKIGILDCWNSWLELETDTTIVVQGLRSLHLRLNHTLGQNSIFSNSCPNTTKYPPMSCSGQHSIISTRKCQWLMWLYCSYVFQVYIMKNYDQVWLMTLKCHNQYYYKLLRAKLFLERGICLDKELEKLVAF